MFLDGGLSGAGTTAIDSGTLLRVKGLAASTQTSPTTGDLDLASPSHFHSKIADFGAGSTIDLLNTNVTEITYLGHSLSVLNGSTQVAVLHVAGSYTQSDFTTASDGHSGTLILHT